MSLRKIIRRQDLEDPAPCKSGGFGMHPIEGRFSHPYVPFLGCAQFGLSLKGYQKLPSGVDWPKNICKLLFSTNAVQTQKVTKVRNRTHYNGGVPFCLPLFTTKRGLYVPFFGGSSSPLPPPHPPPPEPLPSSLEPPPPLLPPSPPPPG